MPCTFRQLKQGSPQLTQGRTQECGKWTLWTLDTGLYMLSLPRLCPLQTTVLFKIYIQISLFKLVLELGGKGYVVTRRNGVSISIPESVIVDLGPSRQDAYLS